MRFCVIPDSSGRYGMAFIVLDLRTAREEIKPPLSENLLSGLSPEHHNVMFIPIAG